MVSSSYYRCRQCLDAVATTVATTVGVRAQELAPAQWLGL